MTTPANTPVLRLLAGLFMAVMLTGLTAGCSSSNDQSPSSHPAVQPTPPKDLLKDVPNKHRTVRITACRPLHGGGGLALGKVKNPHKTKAKFRITVQFKVAKKPVNWATTTLAVPGHGTAPWAAEKKFPTHGHIHCTIRSVS